jgi:NADPH-dependent 2,4-dienoyl-CoA reductase/sulfur reductase-like enzyme
MPTSERIIIIGAGMAAYSLAREFRKLDKTTPLMLVASDAGHSYAKPMLSNALALGKEARQLVAASAAENAATLGATILAHTRVRAIDRDAREIDTDKGRFAYSKLVLALGADPGQASAPDIYALGDCAEYSIGGAGSVMPYVAPMLAAARAIAATLAGKPTLIAFRPEAVIVKTPSCKLALLPPGPGARGEWRCESTQERTVARFVGEDGVVRGFGLSQHTPALRQGLLAELGEMAV